MDSSRFAVLATAAGVFGAVWNDAGIVRTWMHSETEERTRRQIALAFPQAQECPPPGSIAAAMADVAALLGGEPRMANVDLDMRALPDFDRRVYEVARSIEPGQTMTYGQIAKVLGEEPMRARDVGQALARNPFAPIVPCHRVVAAHGLGGYSAPGGANTKRFLLELEGAAIVKPQLPKLPQLPQQRGLFE